MGIPDIDLERTKKCDKRQKFLAFPSLVEQLYLQRWHTHKKLLLWTCIFWSWKCKKQNLCSEWTSNCILSSLSLSLFHLGLFVLFQIATNNPQLEDLEEDTKAQLSTPKWSYSVWVIFICSTKSQFFYLELIILSKITLHYWHDNDNLFHLLSNKKLLLSWEKHCEHGENL